MERGATECFLCGTAIDSQEPEMAPEPEIIPESEIVELVCPMCGASVSADATECPGCGEPFAPLDNGEPAPEQDIYEETAIEEESSESDYSVPESAIPLNSPEFEENEVINMDTGEELEVPDDMAVEATEDSGLEISEDVEYCPACESPLDENGFCPVCDPLEKIDEATDGCPICGSKDFSVESGDLVSCRDCGNVYIRKEYGGAEQSWKWKFWVGLVFIVVGDIGVALGSYVHNVLEWSPIGNIYLGYGWIDQLVGIIGIVLFVVGLLLFAWSFKREREVQCPSCKVMVLESQLTEVEEDEEEILPEELAVESALEEIDEAVECPNCGVEVSMFDTSCPNCGALFEMEDEFEEGSIESEDFIEEPIEPAELKHGSELDEEDMIMESLELEEPEGFVELDGNGIEALNELESAFDAHLEDEMEITPCPSCGAMIGKGLDTCPNCGAAIGDDGGE